MDGVQRGVILYGQETEAVAAALCDHDRRYVLDDRGEWRPGQVTVLRLRTAAEADAARTAAPGITWLVVELSPPGSKTAHASDPLLWLNVSTVDPATAAKAINEPDLVTWYEAIDPAHVVAVDGRPALDDYSNLTIVVPDGNRLVAHAVRIGGDPPTCLPNGTDVVLRSDDLWALAPLRPVEVCQTCAARHG